MRRLDLSVLAAYVFNPRLSIDEFYHHVTQMLQIFKWSNKAELLNKMGRVLEARHQRGLCTVLIIDEAHELSDYVLEEIRLLLNFESDNAKHLQIVLSGQPELREKLNQPNLRQLKDRVALRCKMHPLPNVDEVERYITERLLIAGSDQPNIFTPGAIDFIFQCSEGFPRRINNLCDNSLIAAYAAGEQVIGHQIIEEVADNLDLLPRREALLTKGKKVESVSSARILTAEAREELWKNQKRAEPIVKNQDKQIPLLQILTDEDRAKLFSNDESQTEQMRQTIYYVRTCSSCGLTYTEVSLNFCLNCGEPLSNIIRRFTNILPE